jgi:phage terminase large subunit-like protein
MVEHYLNTDSYIKPIRAFRGSAKTTNTCYIALHRVERADSYYTLIVSDTQTQADSIVADIASMVEDSALPYTIVRNVIGELELSYMGKRYYIVAKGAGASLRGIKRNRRRPDLIIIDDLLNDELIQNKLRIDRLNRWVYKALLPSLDPLGEVYFVGTPMSQGDIFSKICEKYPTVDIPIMNEEGKSNWPDRFPDEWIINKKQEYSDMGMLTEWKQEYELILTDPENRVFDISKINTLPEFPNDLTYYMTIDGAFSEKETADYSAITILGVDIDNNWYVATITMRANPKDVVDKAMEMISRYSIDNIGIEKGSWSLAVGNYFEDCMRDYQVWFTIHDLNTKGSKLIRIKALTSVINTGRLTIIDKYDSEDLMEQIELTTNEGVLSSHDDAIDSLAQCMQLETTYYKSISYNTTNSYF